MAFDSWLTGLEFLLGVFGCKESERIGKEMGINSVRKFFRLAKFALLALCASFCVAPSVALAVTSNITYELDGGTNYTGAPATYTYGVGAEISGVPTKSGSVFMGWCTDAELTNCAMTQTIGVDATGAKTFYAKWISGKFVLTTTNLDANTEFKFRMGAKGTFTVDCGDGGTLSSAADPTDVSGNTITRSGTTSVEYSCTYSTGGVKTIVFDGLATGYHGYEGAAITFGRYYDNTRAEYVALTPTLVAEIYGSLGSIFPTLGNAAGQVPRFNFTFSGCSNLTGSIYEELFSGVTGGTVAMFYSTFSGCTGLTGSIPAGLFSGVAGNEHTMFAATFYGCTGLTGSIPANLFSGVTGSNTWMFYDTFWGCTGLTGNIPAGLFNGVSGSASAMFYATLEVAQV